MVDIFRGLEGSIEFFNFEGHQRFPNRKLSSAALFHTRRKYIYV
jgi:hypothetical protein